MLQQTQTHRVVPKFEAFIKKFPTLESLAKAPLSEVLKLWQGLGYNRRALMLHRAANTAVRLHSGVLPATYEELLKLPGIGPYTAGAVMSFAYNKPTVMIETNIRSALIHEFFLSPRRSLSEDGPRAKKIHDNELLPLLEKAVPKDNPREFYQALMDYGAFIKQKFPNPSRRSTHHAKQSKFEGSRRQLRGKVLKLLLAESALTVQQLAKQSKKSLAFVNEIAEEMVSEGFLIKKEKRYTLS
jgi:A/G-specific adenine glycosylase